MAVDAAGNVYVSDTDNDRVQKFSSTGTYITQWGTSGSGNGQFSRPNGLEIGPAEITQAAGTLQVQDLEQIDQWLVERKPPEEVIAEEAAKESGS